MVIKIVFVGWKKYCIVYVGNINSMDLELNSNVKSIGVIFLMN